MTRTVAAARTATPRSTIERMPSGFSAYRAVPWTSPMPPTTLVNGLIMYAAKTNLLQSVALVSDGDADMSRPGVGAWTANTATLTKDTGNVLTGYAQSLKVTNTAGNGSARRTGALSANSAITASVYYKSAFAGAGLKLTSTPSNTVIGSSLGVKAAFGKVVVSGAIGGTDTGWQLDLIGGANNTEIAYFNNAWVSSEPYDTGNSDSSGKAFSNASRQESMLSIPTPSGFNVGDFSVVGCVSMDHVYNRAGVPDVTNKDRFFFGAFIDAANWTGIAVNDDDGAIHAGGILSGVATYHTDAVATAPNAGDIVSFGFIKSPVTGVTILSSKNGGAVASFNLNSAPAQSPISGSYKLFVGSLGANGYPLDGVIGIVRIFGPGETIASLSPFVLDPYQAPVNRDLAVWTFDGKIRQISGSGVTKAVAGARTAA